MATSIAPQAHGRPPSPPPQERRLTWLPQLPSTVRSIFFIGDEGPMPSFDPPIPQPRPANAIPLPGQTGVVTRGAAPRPTAPPALKRNDSGPRVRELQQLLRDNGMLNGEITGIFDAETERAVITFQGGFVGPDGQQIDDDGRAGATTIAALRTRRAWLRNGDTSDDPIKTSESDEYARLGETTLRLRDVGLEVTRAQTLLRELGYNVQVTGAYDQVTFDSVQDFQRRYNSLTGGKLDVDGAIGPATGFAMCKAADVTTESTGSWLEYAQRAAAQSGTGALAPIGYAAVPPPPAAMIAPPTATALPLLRPGSTDKVSVTILQNQLVAFGYQLTPDGDYGAGTAAAVADFQRVYSLFTGETVAADGIAGQGTHRAIAAAAQNGLFNRLPAPLRTGRIVTGYYRGTPTRIVVRTVGDGSWLETRAALAYNAMRSAGVNGGRPLTTSESFRSNDEQRVLYNAYRAARRRGDRNHAVAASPGWSNHQFGIAVDIYTTKEHEGTFPWLRSNARSFGFSNTVSSEPWHWEYRSDRVPNAVRRFYGLPELARDAVATAPGALARRAKRNRRR